MPDLQCRCRVFGSAGGQAPLLTVMKAQWEDETLYRHGLLLGDGGMGKSTAMFWVCRELTERRRTTLFLPMQMLRSTGETLEQHILRVLYKTADEQNRGRLLRLIEERHTEPGLILLADGFNELDSEAARRYVMELKRLGQYPGVQILISSRLDFLKNYGMTGFEMLRTCDLRDEQIRPLFSEDGWEQILCMKPLHILLRNPMMALLYAKTCPILERHENLEFCQWKLPVCSASDLLHNYCMAQVALMLERGEVDGRRVFYSFCAVRFILPYLGFRAEQGDEMTWTFAAFERVFDESVCVCETRLPDSEPLQRIRRIYRLPPADRLDRDGLYDLLLSEMCLLRDDGVKVFFPHQVFRDYMAAVYLYDCLNGDEAAPPEWRERTIRAGVVQYLRKMHGVLWGEQGMMRRILDPWRGRGEGREDHFVENVLNCWLPEGREENTVRDLSCLDLRKVSLSEHLKYRYRGTILLDGAKVSRQTFVNERCHDRITALAFSHDSRTLAAVSANGLISVCNVLTRSQMAVGSVPSGEGARIGFSAEDYLMLKTGENIWIWPSISYDHRRPAGEGEQILDQTRPAEQGSPMARLIGIMRDSDLLGSAYVSSEDQSLLAVGYHSGQIQLWNAKEQQCVMEFTLGDGQIITASFSPGGELAAVGAGGPLIQLWRVAEERCVGVLHFDQPVRRVRFPETDRILECVYSDGQFVRRDMASGEVTVHQNPIRLLRIQERLRRKLNGVHIQKLAAADNGNAIIVEKNSPRVWVWNEAEGVLNECRGHSSHVIDAEICRADPRYAASYSDERLGIGREIRKPLKGQKVIRAWALRKGNCMQRLPTQRRTIRRLQFFTANRIILAAFAANGDIMLWELHNRMVSGVERGHWDPIEILKNAPAQPMECAVTQDAKTFIGAYADGTILKKSFQTNTSRSFRLFPGADLSALRWETLDGPDEVLEILKRYRQTES